MGKLSPEIAWLLIFLGFFVLVGVNQYIIEPILRKLGKLEPKGKETPWE